ncbi:MAG: AraC family transcriptional regulator [Cyanobacteria bacterium P01_B01_bin.77]
MFSRSEISLTYNDLQEMLMESQQTPGRRETGVTYRAEGDEISWELQKPFGKWSNYTIDLREGFNLSVVDWNAHQDLQLTLDVQMQPLYGFNFCVAGGLLTNVSGTPSEFITHADEASAGFFQGDIKTVGKLTAGQQLTLVQLQVDPRLLADTLSAQPQQSVDHIFATSQEGFQWRTQAKTPAMTIALNQILHCPYQGLTKRLYVESKALELIALQLDQLHQDRPYISSPLKPRDVARIYLARDILIRNLEHPPSLLTLAKQSDINSFKLKQGFRQIFNTTVFGYLRTQRMEEAKRLLELGDLNVTQVAQAVGYAHPGKFAAAFKKKFGITPKVLKAK